MLQVVWDRRDGCIYSIPLEDTLDVFRSPYTVSPCITYKSTWNCLYRCTYTHLQEFRRTNVYQRTASTATPAERPDDICMVCHSPLGLDYLGMSARTNCLSHSGKGMERIAWRSNWIHFKLEIWCLKGSLFSPIRFSCFAVIECMPVASIHATSSQQKMWNNWIPNVQISQESGTWQSDATSIVYRGHWPWKAHVQTFLDMFGSKRLTHVYHEALQSFGLLSWTAASLSLR